MFDVGMDSWAFEPAYRQFGGLYIAIFFYGSNPKIFGTLRTKKRISIAIPNANWFLKISVFFSTPFLLSQETYRCNTKFTNIKQCFFVIFGGENGLYNGKIRLCQALVIKIK